MSRERRGGVVADCRGQFAAVAEDETLPVARGDRVGARSTEDDVVAGARGDGVVTAGVDFDRVRGRERVVDPGDAAAEGQQAAGGNQVDVARIPVGRHVIDVTVVAEHDVVAVGHRGGFAGVGGDAVAPEAAEDDVPTDSGGDDVVAADERADRADLAQGDVEVVEWLSQVRRAVDGHRGQDLAVVADHDVAARARIEHIPRRTAEDDVVAAAAGDNVAAADIDGEARDHVDVVRISVGHHIVDGAIVTQRDVVPIAQIDSVGVGAAQDDIVAQADGNHIRPAIVERGRFDKPQGDRVSAEARRVGYCGRDPATVPDDDVPAVACVDQVTEPTADEDVVAAEAGDDVRTAGERRRGAGDLVDIRRIAVPVVDQDAVVAQDDVVVVHRRGRQTADGDGVALVPTQDDVPTGARGNRVRPPDAESERLDAAEREG